MYNVQFSLHKLENKKIVINGENGDYNWGVILSRRQSEESSDIPQVALNQDADYGCI